MTELVLQIHPLEHGQTESELILKHLSEIELHNLWKINSPTEETNSVLMFVQTEGKYSEEWAIRQALFRNATKALRLLPVEFISFIKSKDVDIALRLVTPEFYVPIEPAVITECSRLGIGINVFNEKLFASTTNTS